MDIDTQLKLIILLGIAVHMSGRSEKSRRCWGLGILLFGMAWSIARILMKT